MMLALKLGRTLEELGRSMSSHEFALWAALYRQNQWGDMYGYEQAGIVAATVANYAGMARAKGAAPATPADFMPYLPPDAAPEAEAEPDPIAYFQAIAANR